MHVTGFKHVRSQKNMSDNRKVIGVNKRKEKDKNLKPDILICMATVSLHSTW
jgi:hypothetical protein